MAEVSLIASHIQTVLVTIFSLSAKIVKIIRLNVKIVGELIGRRVIEQIEG